MEIGVKERGSIVREKSPKLERLCKLYKRGGLFQDASNDIQISVASDTQELETAYRLVHDVFVEKGYIQPQKTGLRFRVYEAIPEMYSFVAKHNNNIVAVQSIVGDSEFGLPSEHPFDDYSGEYKGPFQDEIGSLRAEGRTICEATNESVIPDYRNKKNGIPTELMRCCLAYAKNKGYNSIVTAISPSHFPLYELMSFKEIGDLRDYCKITGDKAMLVHLKVDELDGVVELFEESGGTAGSPAEIHEWFCAQNPHERLINSSEEKRKALYSNADALEKLFFDTGGLRDNLSEEQLQTICNKWQQESLPLTTAG